MNDFLAVREKLRDSARFTAQTGTARELSCVSWITVINTLKVPLENQTWVNVALPLKGQILGVDDGEA